MKATRQKKVVEAALIATCLLFSGTKLCAAQATLNGDTLSIPVVVVGEQAFQVSLTLIAGSEPLQLLVSSAAELTEFSTEDASTFQGARLNVPSIDVDGVAYWANFDLASAEPPTFVFIDAGAVAAPPAPPACVRPQPDPSHGPNDPAIIAGWSIDRTYMVEALAPDAIPSIDSPVFTTDFAGEIISDDTRIVGVKVDDQVRAYSHTILDWHEVVNDQYLIDGQMRPVTLSYCPLTGSAMLWKGKEGVSDPSFGVSGKLFNSNLVMYDRASGSYWSQMLEQGIAVSERLTVPDRLQVIETTWGTWKEMYPHTTLLSDQTGISRPYGLYPYGSYQSNNLIIPPPDTVILGDNRLHRKERVVGINVGDSSKVYPINDFGNDIAIINDRVGDMDVVVTGSAGFNFGAIFNRQLEDCTTLDFTAEQGRLPVVMSDNEGNEWDIFGVAVSGPRIGTHLAKTNSYIAFWFAWTAFFPGTVIHQ